MSGGTWRKRARPGAWVEKWVGSTPGCGVGGANIEETWTFYRLPRTHHKHLKSTNVLERMNQELKRRTLVVRIFPNEESCARWCGRWRRRFTRRGWKAAATWIWNY